MGYAIPALILAGIGSYALYSFRVLDQQVATIYDDRVVPLQQLKVISDQYAINVIDAVNKTDHELLSPTEALRLIEQAERQIEAEWQAYRGTYLTVQEQQLVDEVEQLFVQSNRQIDLLKQTLRSQNAADVAQFNGALYASIDPVTSKIQELINLQLEVAQSERKQAEVVYRQTVSLFIIILMLALIGASPLGYWISRTITATLRNTIGLLTQTSSELAATTTQQEQTASHQASAVAETTASMGQLDASSQQSAEQAKQSSDRASRVLAQAELGMKTVDETLNGMQQLQEKVLAIATAAEQLQRHTTQIGGVTALVGDLAAQTNILALNASIEAVQAGEQGAGFAIIATEIRKLATQSRASSAQIDALVEDVQTAIQSVVSASTQGVETVQVGIQVAQETAKAFSTIRQDIENVAVHNQQIYRTAQEQAASIRQMVSAMSNLDVVAHDTASSISQTQTSTQQLSQAASQLAEML